MSRRPPLTPTAAWAASASALLLGAAFAFLSLTAAGQGPGPPAGEETVTDFAAAWNEVESLVSEDKLEAASERAGRIREAARAAGDDEELTRALVREVQLRSALHGYETAVRFLIEEPWPEDPLSRVVLDLFYAHSLVRYLQVYWWEVAQRERVETGDEVDLKRWNRDRIYQEAQRAFRRIWERRESWGAEPIGEIAEYLQQNDYPPRIRGTLRDAVTYLWVELLANTTFWRPEEHQGVYRLDLDRLAAGGPADFSGGGFGDLAGVELVGDGGGGGDDEKHPLLQLAAILADLEAWHLDAGRPEAAFEARRERLVRLAGSAEQAADKERLRRHLERRTEELGKHYEWWSMGVASIAEMVRGEPGADRLVRAREIALEGEKVHPGSLGARRCRHVATAIAAPSYRLAAMAHDGPGRRSIEVTHRNLPELHFRAYHLDLVDHVAGSEDYYLLPVQGEVQEIVEQRTPDAEWSVELPSTPDFRDHRTFVTPPMSRPGLYVVVASARRDFETGRNRFQAVNLVLGDLVLVTREQHRAVEVEVRSGRSGFPLADVAVNLYRHDWRKGHRRVAVARSGIDGRVRFDLSGEEHSYFLVAEYQDQVAIDTTEFYPLDQPGPGKRSGALIYTDRTVYRPGQPLMWKAVPYRGGGERSRFETLPETRITVELVDANGQVAASETATTNGFGTASGRFDVPTGRLLGVWRLRTSLGGDASLRVEEYKRPTFEVTVGEPSETLRLNRPATLEGEARYYFGLPVVDAEVAWRVSREPVYPWWWWWYGRPAAGVETVAAGTAAVDEEGRFRVAFTPEADEREAESGVTYRFRLQAEVTDPGGETREASRSFRLGFVAVDARIDAEERFFRPGRPLQLTIRRSDLDGTARPGAGRFRLFRLVQPETALLPADQPRPDPPAAPSGPPPYETPGDRLRPRWESQYSPRQVMGLWDDGEEVARGGLAHGEDGVATLELPPLPTGAYRLRYETEDAFGARFETRRELVVAEAGNPPPALPALLLAERSTVRVGETARLLVGSGLPHQEMVVEIHRWNRRVERRVVSSGGLLILEIPVREKHRGGFGVTLTAVRDHQLMRLSERVFVPWDDRQLELAFATFRDRLRPGSAETWTVTVRGPGGEPLGAGAAELLAYMYDRSLDLFAPHTPPRLEHLYGDLTASPWARANLGPSPLAWSADHGLAHLPGYPVLSGDALLFDSGHGIGGLGSRALLARKLKAVGYVFVNGVSDMEASFRVGGEAFAARAEELVVVTSEAVRQDSPAAERGGEREPRRRDPLRHDFSETAFFHPHLLTGPDGSVSFEFEVPDSVTEWNVWVHAVTRDLAGASLERRARSVKELMVRPYLPRFLREGDRAELKIVVNSAGEEPLAGRVDFDLVDPETGESRLAEFGLGRAEVEALAFEVEPGGGADLTVPVRAPSRVGSVAVEVRASAGAFSDGERRILPLLPGRVHLAQSRFAALKGRDRRVLRFADLAAAGDDRTLIHDQLVVTLDAQLFYGVLNALPYLVDYPYECTEQTLNRFVSTGIVSSVFDRYPAVARMAKKLAARRDTRLPTWEAADPNRKMALVETPWLRASRGGEEAGEDLIKVLDPRAALAQRRSALGKLRQAQTSLGAFPWWPGGPPSPYMTLYILYGFSKALEFGVEVPRDMVEKAWGYLHRHYLDETVRRMADEDCCPELVTFVNYVLSSYPDASWTGAPDRGGLFTDAERREMLAFSFRHWRDHSPLSKAQLALTLRRMDRSDDAMLVFDSLMDSARSGEDEGTFWAPEDRAWLWYNDTVEGHSFALRAMTELSPDDPRRHGLVQWLLLNRQLNHWKSTRATAEVIYALVHYLEREGTLGVQEAATVAVGPDIERRFLFEPDEYTGADNHLVVPGAEVTPAMAEVVVEKETQGFLFASATWHFSTEELPAEARGDFFQVTRRYFRRVHDGREWTLQPLDESRDGGSVELAPGDQVEVQLSIRAKHAAEYVHLRDPRGAGFEPESLVSRFKWDLGLGWYEEVRDSGTNFFFEWLPAGEYTFKYRLRASLGGTFRVGPATLQSMYAPEFTAYSSGAVLSVG